jgi:hypothetical protein
MKRRNFIAGSVSLLVTPAHAATVGLELGGSKATIEIEGEASPDFHQLAQRWIRQSATVVYNYYGRFPVPDFYIHVIAGNGTGVRGGQTFPGEQPLIRMRVGRDSAESELLRGDWVMVHEMVHLAFPWMNGRHNWMAEGLAVYVESIARLHAGHLTAAQVWGDFVRMMPRGLPAPGDGGYDVTVNWGRTYWGGAIFCLIADLTIRAETSNRFGLQHALRAINRDRDFRHEWDFLETLAIGDAATGRKVLVTQYEAMKTAAVSPDLEALWRDLGIAPGAKSIAFDDAAPLAQARRAIERPA